MIHTSRQLKANGQKRKKILTAASVLLVGIILGSITIAGNTSGRRANRYLNLGDKYLSEPDYDELSLSDRS